MSALDVDAFKSKQFTFVIGKNQAEFTVHSAIIAKQSQALNVLINGSMAEASDGRAIDEDVTEDIFIRFCQFAYTRDYVTPDLTHDPSIELPHIPDRNIAVEPERRPVIKEPTPVEWAGQPTDDWAPMSKKSKQTITMKPSKSTSLRQSLDALSYDTETSQATFASRCKVRPNSNPTEDYTHVFLGHAELYVFAEKWGIPTLKTLALSKLHKTLTSFTLYAVRRPDIVSLLRFTFSNENTPDREGLVDDLRQLVMMYTACEVESLVQCPEFMALIGEGGPLAQDLVKMLMKRI